MSDGWNVFSWLWEIILTNVLQVEASFGFGGFIDVCRCPSMCAR